jgi:hypothetical protein
MGTVQVTSAFYTIDREELNYMAETFGEGAPHAVYVSVMEWAQNHAHKALWGTVHARENGFAVEIVPEHQWTLDKQENGNGST